MRSLPCLSRSARCAVRAVPMLGGLLLAASAFATPPAVSLVRDDLLVTDVNHAQVLRVKHTNGNVAVFSPREGQTNLLTFPGAIAIDASGFIYVVDHPLNQNSARMVVIDPYSGEQSIAHVCPPNQFCHDLDLGQATGLAISSSSPGYSSLYEIAWNGLFALGRSSVTQWGSALVSNLDVTGQLYGMITPSAIAYSAAHTTVYVPDGSTLNEEDVSNPGAFTRDVNTGGPQIPAVAYEPTLDQVFFTQWESLGQGCDAAHSGLRHYANGQVYDDSLGGLLRCPTAIAEGDPQQAGFPFYVVDQGSMTTFPSDPRIIVVLTDGLPGAPQAQLVDFATTGITGVNPNGLAISPTDFVPEPGEQALAAAVFAALMALATLRRADP